MRTAIRHWIIDRNPVGGFRGMGTGRRTAHLETAAQIVALLEAAGDLDREGRLRRGHGRVLLAVLVHLGLRIDEALSLRHRDVDLTGGVLRVRDGKTENAARNVPILPPLHDDLAELKARRDEPRDALIFATSTGSKDWATKMRRRLLAKAIERANVALEDDGAELVPINLTPHSLRHTTASARCALGDDPRLIADVLGHADVRFTPNVYAGAVGRGEGELEALRALVHGAPIDAAQAEAQSSSVARQGRAVGERGVAPLGVG